MPERIRHAAQNGLIFVSDIDGGQSPYPPDDQMVQSTSSCIKVRCLHEIDGEAELTLGPAEEVSPAYDPAFDGSLETPSRELIVSGVTGEPLLKAKVPGETTRVRIWRSHPIWPEQVIIGWG